MRSSRKTGQMTRFGDRKTGEVLNGKPELIVVQKPVDAIGTDRQQTRVLVERRVNLPVSLGLRPSEHLNSQGQCNLPSSEAPTAWRDTLSAPFVLALMAVVDTTITQWFKDNPAHADREKDMRGPRPNCQNRRVFQTVRPVGAPETARAEAVAVPHYRARPLDGVWATAPYLHNGSVPTLRDVLIPQNQRPKKFCVGSRQFDPVNVGLAMKDEDCGAWTTFQHPAARQQQRRSFIRGHGNRSGKKAKRRDRTGTDKARTRCAG